MYNDDMICPHCATEWPDELAGTLKFCGSCGKPMTDSFVESGSPGAIATSDPGGELRFMTVLFADLADFTSFAEDRSPDEVARIVGDLLQRLGKVVEGHNGGVDKFLGDAIVATFGLLNPDPNATRNAVRAGLAMQEEAGRFNRERGFNFGLRVGIHAGEAMFRAIGGAWTVMGDTVNTASRIQSTAAPGRVWISMPVYEEVRRYFDILVRPAIELKGKKHTIQPFEVLAERTTPFVEMPPFVGREKEWQVIQSAFADCRRKETLRVMAVRGPAGVGKSRLMWELREWLQRQPEMFRLDVIQYDHSERLPSHGLNALIRNRFVLPLELNDEGILNQLAQQMTRERPDLPPERQSLAVEFFAFVLGILRPDFHIQSMDGAAKWNNAFLEIKSWLEAQASQSPWIIIIEDAQKGDADTAAFLDWALTMEWRAPIFVLATLREEDYGSQCYWYASLNRWLKEGLAQELRVRELVPEVLSKALIPIGEGVISEGLALRIADHTEGNPLFATELVLLIKGQHQDYSALEKMPLPGSIREVMEARIERLGAAGKEVAKRGALMGRRFTLEAVERIWERPRPEMLDGVRVLQETETIYEEASKLFAGEMEKVFRHGRLQEAALARIPREERARWLMGLEEWAKTKLETFGAYWEGAGIMLVPLIARSRIEQDDRVSASLWHEVLGWLHKKHHRNQEAAAAFRESLENARGLRRLTLARLIADLDLMSGEVERARGLLRAALEEDADVGPDAPDLPPRLSLLIDDPLARWDRLTRPEGLIAVKLALAEPLIRLGLAKEAEATFRESEAELEFVSGEIADILRIRWANQWGYFLSEVMANPSAAEAVYQSLRKRVNLDSPAFQTERLALLNTEFNIEMRLGRYSNAHALAEETLRLAQATRNTREETRAWSSRGMTLNALGDWNIAASSYERALSLARSIGERRREAISLHNLGIIRMDQARYEEARECQENYLAISRATGNRLADAYGPAYLGLIAGTQGDFSRAETLIEDARLMAAKNDWRRLIGLTSGFSGLLALYRWFKTRHRESLEKALTMLSKSEEAWKHIDEAGELYAALAYAAFKVRGKRSATAILKRAHQNVDESWTAARIFLELAEAVIERKPLDSFVEWFKEHDFIRAVEFTEKVAAI